MNPPKTWFYDIHRTIFTFFKPQRLTPSCDVLEPPKNRNHDIHRIIFISGFFRRFISFLISTRKWSWFFNDTWTISKTMEKISICPDLFLREFLKLSVKFRKSRYFDLYKTMITAFPSNSRTSYMSVQIISLFNEVLTCFSSIYTVLREFDDPHVIHRTIFKATKNHTKSSIN
jgi:hypothetical protein